MNALGSILPFMPGLDPLARVLFPRIVGAAGGAASTVATAIITRNQKQTDDIARAIERIPALMRAQEQINTTLARGRAAKLKGSEMIALDNGAMLVNNNMMEVLNQFYPALERALREQAITASQVPDWARPMIGMEVPGISGLGVIPVFAVIVAGFAAIGLVLAVDKAVELIDAVRGPQSRVNVALQRAGFTPGEDAEQTSPTARAIASAAGFGTVAIVALVLFTLMKKGRK